MHVGLITSINSTTNQKSTHVDCNTSSNPQLLRDLRKCRHFIHTSYLETFHNVILKYAPKRLYFPYSTMKMRLQLAVIDHNVGIGRDGHDLKTERVWKKATKCCKNRKVHVHCKKSHEWRHAILLDVIKSI